MAGFLISRKKQNMLRSKNKKNPNLDAERGGEEKFFETYYNTAKEIFPIPTKFSAKFGLLF